MDTWEVVLILILLTISLSVIANREVPLSLINLLDNTYFQMVVLVATLVVATISPPVAIVSISTIVTIYYIRNVVKVQIMKMQRKAEIEREEAVEREREAELLRRAAENNEEPRIEIHETTSTVTTTSKDIIVDKEALEDALKEHETRQRPDNTQQFTDASNNLSVQNVPNPDVVDMIDPRRSTVPTGVEAFDLKAGNNAEAPLAEKIRPALGAVDSPVFTGALETPASYNEMKAPKKMRAYRDNYGQYDINEERPLYEVERYETADYMPGKDMGSNNFELIGTSIDDKINILTKGVMPSSEPPPEFDQPLPAKSR